MFLFYVLSFFKKGDTIQGGKYGTWFYAQLAEKKSVTVSKYISSENTYFNAIVLCSQDIHEITRTLINICFRKINFIKVENFCMHFYALTKTQHVFKN